jgi:sigma-54 dependent transcriptional regulator, acetoin dehydrogenase operon transcriptional activator AcoR
MGLILFAAEESSLKPAIAAAVLQTLGIQGLQCEIAAPEIDAGSTPPLDISTILKDQGLNHQPGVILPLSGIRFFGYDLVVFFADAAKAPFPVLPGSPAVVRWDVPGVDLSSPSEGIGRLCKRIKQLVTDLFSQGYYQALVQAQRNSLLVLDNLQEGILAHDLQRNIFFFNKAAERITGYSRREILGRDCHLVFPEGFCKAECSFCDDQQAPPAAKRYPLIFRARSGEDRHIEMSTMPIKEFLGSPVGVVASFRDLTREHELASRLGEASRFSGIIGRDQKMLEVFNSIRELAVSNVSVLLQGESGTGKELVAASIHNEGNRAGKLFVPVNCGALPENLLESELFGHVRGAFTGAVRDKKGRFELADGGTIFLDEIGDITPAMQVKLLRVLQDGTFQRVGGEETLKVDTRIISATHKDLKKEIAAGRFREDLFYRLCVVPLSLPPLRARRQDIPILADSFLKRYLAEEERAEIILSSELMEILLSYHWPGNVRELQNVIRYLLVRCREEIAHPRHLPPNLLEEPRTVDASSLLTRTGKKKLNPTAVKQALAASGNNRVQAARALGVARATLYRFLDKHRN